MMSTAWILPLALLTAPAVAAAQETVVSPSSKDIVVTGRRLSDTAAALAACLARHCPPDEDIDASLGHAENQFVGGDYHGARKTLLASVHRNKEYAKQYPVAVSDLLRANARIAAHLGLGEQYRIGMLDVVSALKAGLPDTDSRVLIADVAVGDSYIRFGRIRAAENKYEDVAAKARHLGLTAIEGYAELRRASLLSLLAVKHREYRQSAKKALDQLIADPAAGKAVFAKAARVLKARMLARDGDATKLDALLADYRRHPPSRTPLLIAFKPIDLGERAAREEQDGSVTNQISMVGAEDQWIDVGFWITPAGEVEDAAVMRQSDGYSGGWANAVIASIRSRQYTPVESTPGDPGLFRVERYTLTADHVQTTGSRIMARSPRPRIEMLDLSKIPPDNG